MKVQQWTKLAEGDTSPMQASTAEGGQSKGLIKTLVAHGIQASASGGWNANKTHHGHDLTESLIDMLRAMLDPVQEAATRDAGPPIKKAKAPKAKHHPHFNLKG